MVDFLSQIRQTSRSEIILVKCEAFVLMILRVKGRNDHPPAGFPAIGPLKQKTKKV